MLIAEIESYDTEARRWIDVVGKHYLNNAPPGCLFDLVVRAAYARIRPSVDGDSTSSAAHPSAR